MKKYLFVGGKADGHMIEANYEFHRVPYMEAPFSCPYEDFDKYSIPIKEEKYRKIMWQSGDGINLEFFALESMDNHDIMKMVLDNYSPKQEVELDSRIKGMKFLLEDCLSLLKDTLKHSIPSSLNRRIWDTTLRAFRFLNINKI